MNIDYLIKKTEEDFIPAIESFFIRKWGDTNLWSHDLCHHRRVWNYAKELLQFTGIPDVKFVEKLLIACYLHDIGMTVDREEIHGIQSKKFCELYLEEKNINPAEYADLLDAIENHDNKDYAHKPTENRLLQLLSVADDLDAFGYTGILRYADIYLERGVSMTDLGKQIFENSSKRFMNFEKTFSEFPELVEKHRNRFCALNNFYSSFDQQK